MKLFSYLMIAVFAGGLAATLVGSVRVLMDL